MKLSSFLGSLLVVLGSLVAAPVWAAGVTVAWDASPETGVAGYVVHYGEQPGVYSTEVDVPGATTLRLDTLTVGRTYYFAVRAYSSDGLYSALSSEVSTTITDGALGQATFTVTLDGTGHLPSRSLSWTPVADAQAYYLYVGTAAGLKDIVNTGETAATTVTLPVLAAAQTFVARLFTKQAGAWRFTDLTFQPSTTTGPLAPAVFTEVLVGGRLTDRVLEWGAVADAQAYYLYVGTSDGGKDVINSGELTGTAYTLPGLAAGQTFFGRIYTKQAGQWRSTGLTFQPLATGGGAQLLTPTAGQQGVSSADVFTWTPVADAQAYYLYLGTTAGGKDVIDSGELRGTQWTVAALPAGQHLYARLWTKQGGTWSASATEFDTAPRARLIYPTATADDVSTAERFTWTRVSGAQAYRLTVGTTLHGTELADSGATSAAAWLVTGLPAGVEVFADLATQLGGVWSVETRLVTTAVTARLLGAGDGADLGLGVRWTTILGAEAYRVTVGTTAGAADLLESPAGLATTVATPALPARTPLAAEVWTLQAGTWTSRATTLTLAGTSLVSPRADAAGQAAIAASGQRFSWTPITNAEVYYLGIGTTPGAKDLVDTGETVATTYAAGALPLGRALYVSLWTRVAGVWNVTTSSFVGR